ncbi:MCE family protein [Rhodococcus sp. HNM0569]|nr:MCE family protein [Rhodococcus sp. HNM0569]
MAMRGVVAVAVVVVVGVLMVLRGTGGLRQDPEVTVAVPSSVGLINGEAPVRYQGVNIGRIAAIESGPDESIAKLQIDADSIGLVPAGVVARVVPRTFFGDIYIQLMDGSEAPSADHLADGEQIPIDTGPDAVALYDVYTKMVDVLDRMQPHKMQTALTALAQALDGRGEAVGRTMTNLSAVLTDVDPALREFLDATPRFREVMDALNTATPDIVQTLESATNVSNEMVAHQDSFAQLTEAAAGFGAVLAPFVGANQQNLVTVFDATGTILATTAANPEGLSSTLAHAESFGAAGTRVFSSGRFDITAVPTFAEPLPYGPQDCVSYGPLTGPNCGGPSTAVGAEPTEGEAAPIGVVDAAAEAPVLGILEGALTGASESPEAAAPNPATVTMLGPLVRGTQVTVR